jgi:hypothetical protein
METFNFHSTIFHEMILPATLLFPQPVVPPAVFHGEAFLPALCAPGQHMRMLIKTPFLTLDLQAEEKIDFKLEGLTKARLNLEDWQHYLRLLEILGEDELEIEVEGKEAGMLHITSEMRWPTPLRQKPWFVFLAEAARRGEALLKLAGAQGEVTSLAELNEAAEMIGLAHACLFQPTTVPPQTFQSADQVLLGIAISDYEFLQADYVVVAGVALAYACRVTMRPEPVGTGLLWRQVDIKPEKLIVIDNTVEAFNAFVAETKTRVCGA